MLWWPPEDGKLRLREAEALAWGSPGCVRHSWRPHPIRWAGSQRHVMEMRGEGPFLAEPKLCMEMGTDLSIP